MSDRFPKVKRSFLISETRWGKAYAVSCRYTKRRFGFIDILLILQAVAVVKQHIFKRLAQL